MEPRYRGAYQLCQSLLHPWSEDPMIHHYQSEKNASTAIPIQLLIPQFCCQNVFGFWNTNSHNHQQTLCLVLIKVEQCQSPHTHWDFHNSHLQENKHHTKEREGKCIYENIEFVVFFVCSEFTSKPLTCAFGNCLVFMNEIKRHCEFLTNFQENSIAIKSFE